MNVRPKICANMRSAWHCRGDGRGDRRPPPRTCARPRPCRAAPSSSVDEARGHRCVIGRVAVGQHIDVGLDVGEHAAHDMALALHPLAADDRALRPRNLDGPVGAVVVVDVDSGIGAARRGTRARSRRWRLPHCSRGGELQFSTRPVPAFRCLQYPRPGGVLVPETGLYDGRGDRIRTCDPLLPKQMRYQAALLPDAVRLAKAKQDRNRPFRTRVPTGNGLSNKKGGRGVSAQPLLASHQPSGRKQSLGGVVRQRCVGRVAVALAALSTAFAALSIALATTSFDALLASAAGFSPHAARAHQRSSGAGNSKLVHFFWLP